MRHDSSTSQLAMTASFSFIASIAREITSRYRMPAVSPDFFVAQFPTALWASSYGQLRWRAKSAGGKSIKATVAAMLALQCDHAVTVAVPTSALRHRCEE